MLTVEERKVIWEANDEPPPEKPHAFNAFVTVTIEDITIGGEVCWDHPLQAYVFRLAQETSDMRHETYEITLSAYNYLTFRSVVRQELGVYVTRGIYDKQCPPKTMQEQLPESLRCVLI
jgi:hypothetical protein